MTAPRRASNCWPAGCLAGLPDYFRLHSFRVIDERRRNAKNELVTLSEATIKADGQGGEHSWTWPRATAR